MRKQETKKPAAGKTAAGKDKKATAPSKSSGRAAQPAKRTNRICKKGFVAWLNRIFRKKKRKTAKTKNNPQTKKSVKTVEEQKKKVQTRTNKARKNVSKRVPNGRTLQTRDEYFEGAKDYRKPGYEDKGLYRSAVVVDSNRNDELALIVLTTKGEDIPGKKKSKYRPFIETKDDDGEPIKVSGKFKENKARKDLSPEAVSEIKKLTFKNAGNAESNREKVRQMKGRK